MLAGLAHAVRVWADGAGGLGVFAIAVLDSSLLALPNATDALVMYLSVQRPGLWWYYAAMAVAGLIVGSWPLYALARRGGQAYLKRHSSPWLTRAVAWYERSAFAALAVPAFAPPPMPLKPSVLLAGATAYPLWRVVAALVVGRGARHLLEAGLAATFREQAVATFERHGTAIGVGTAVATALACLVALAWSMRQSPA